MASYITALGILLWPLNLIVLYICSLAGCVLGAIPGLSGGLGIILILPVIFALDTNLSFAMLVGMYVGGVSGSFISAVLTGIPGSAASAGTCYDGYPMTKKGKAGRALSISITASFIGTVASVTVATLCAGFIAKLGLILGPWEHFSLCLMAITMVIGFSNHPVSRGLLSAFFGLWLSTVGVDNITGQLRFASQGSALSVGINVACFLIGIFALKKVVVFYAKGKLTMPQAYEVTSEGVRLHLKDIAGNIHTILNSLCIGMGIGFLPGMGSGLSNLVAYGYARSRSKNPEEFGTGADAGIWATEVANNAGIGGAVLPLVSLGIPGDATTVLLMSAMLIRGLQPGPMFIRDNPVQAYLIFAAVLVSAVLIFITELFAKKWFPLVFKIPCSYLYSVILVICFLGAYTATASMSGVYLMLVFGFVGVAADFFKMPCTPIMLSFVLGSRMEGCFRRGCAYGGGAASFLTRPISIIFLAIAISSLILPAALKAARKRRRARQQLGGRQ